MAASKNNRAAGGKARALKMTPEQRSASARKAAMTKAENAKLPKATHGSTDHPLVIGDVEIPCYVLEDGTRVLSQTGLANGIGMNLGGVSRTGENRLTEFFGSLSLVDFVKPGLLDTLRTPITFMPPHGGRSAKGYPATVLADICEAVLSAREAGALSNSRLGVAKQCEVLVRGFARVGIIALVDEATGYQKDRARDALAKILEAFVAKELQPYVKTFPAEFYEHLFRLRGLPYPPERANYRPRYFGVLTNDIVYGRIAPGLLAELKKQAERDEKSAHLHRRLTTDVGHPKLKEHLASVTTVMKLSDTYPDFISKLNRVHQRFGDTIPLDLEEQDRG